MRLLKLAFPALSMMALFACAISEEAEQRRQQTETSIQEILAQPVDAAEAAEPERCIGEHEYRSFRALNDQYMLFEGRRDKQWVNRLRTRCSELRYGHTLIVKPFSSRRMCDGDQFQVAEWFDWPWYRRWPWRWGSWGTGVICILGEFQAVTEDQVAEIEAVIEENR